MPDQETLERAEQDKREGKSPSTQAGEFVREEIHHIREGKHGTASAKQAVAIGLSKARRAGVELPPPKKGRVSEKTRKGANFATRLPSQPAKTGLSGDPGLRRWLCISKIPPAPPQNDVEEEFIALLRISGAFWMMCRAYGARNHLASYPPFLC